MSLPFIAAITFILFLINVWWDRRSKLRNLPTPVCFFAYMALGLSFFETRSAPRLQAGASLVWGHEKFEFEDVQGYRWRAWFNECGRAFKIKAAWGHPDIVRKGPHPPSIFQPLQYILTVTTSFVYIVDYRRYRWALPHLHKKPVQLPSLARFPFLRHAPRWSLSRLGRR